jgi:hypothetical protein
MKLVLESNATVKGKIIEGIALVPTVSRNGNIYSEEEILKAENLGVELKADWEHTDEIIGSVVYTLDESLPGIRYRAEITSDRTITEGVHKVSIEASINEVTASCTRQRCYNLVSGIRFEGIGITDHPGVPLTTLSIIESAQDWTPITKNCEKCQHETLPTTYTLNINGTSTTGTINYPNVTTKTMPLNSSTSESERIDKLEKELADTKAKLEELTTCKTCGKHKPI